MVAEALEYRRLLSALPNPTAYPVDSAIALGGNIPPGHASPPGFSPSQIKGAYGIDNVSFNGVTGTGSGQTIAIVVAMDNPNFVDSTAANFNTSDLHQFDVAMGLPDPPSFVKVDQNGGTNYPAADFGWANEIALDVEWTHAIAPQANILLVEASSTGLLSLIQGAAQTARSTPGVSVVTMSFEVSEFSGETQYDQYLTTPSGHSGVTFVAASGDTGEPGVYPSFSPDVLSVGATALTLSGNSYGSETAHNTSGGGVSLYENKPSYQYALQQSATFRTTPDVSFDGNPNTGVSVYDSYNGGSAAPWYKIGGTSLASPAWAALIAIANQGRATLGLTSLDGAKQTLPRLYGLPTADFHDITTGATDVGTTFNSAHSGYDLVTGLGTPVSNSLLPDLAGGGTVSGTIYNDRNSNAQLDAGEPGLSGFTAYVDLYHNNTLVGADTSVTSGSDGTYQFTDLPGGNYRFNRPTPAGWNLTTPASNYTLTLGFGSSFTGENIGFQSNGQAAQLAFIQQPTTDIIGHAIAPAITVAVENSDGNILTSDNSTVTLSLATGTGPLHGTLSVNAANGIATFSNVQLDSAETDTLKATDGLLSSATSSSFLIALTPPDIATQIVFGQQPTTAAVGAFLNPPVSVYLEDPSGHIVSTDTSAVTLTLAAGSTTNAPTGTLTVNAINGIARFSNVMFTSAGTASLTAADGILTPATSNTFTTQIVPVKLAFIQQPASANTATPINPAIVVDVEDYLGNPVASDSSAVTLTVAGGSAALGGTVTVNAVNGVATFGDVTLPSVGTFALTATDSALTAATSSSFAVTVPGTLVPAVLRSTLASSLIAGAKVHAAIVVDETNNATVTSVSSVTTQIYAVGIDGTSTLLGSVTRKLPLRAARKYLVTVPITQLPASLSGIYTIKAVVVDPAGNTSTSNVAAGVTIAAPFIALSETFTRVTLAPAVVAGSKSRATATLKIINSGNIASIGTTTVGIYASHDGLTSDAVLIASITRRLSIRANGAIVVTVPILLIPAVLNGNYTILTQVTDPNHAVTSSASNSVVNIASPFVSLSATVGPALPATVAAAKAVSFTITIHNAGNVDSTGLATINVGLSSDQITELPGGTTIMRAVRIPIGKSVVLRLRVTVPATLTGGTYFPFVSFNQPLGSVTATGTTALTVT